MPIVIVGNKTDTARELDRVEVESERVYRVTKKNALLCSKANNPSFESAIGTSRGKLQILDFSGLHES